VLRLSSQDIPTPYNGKLENLTIVQPAQIAEAVQKMMNDQI
jgi:pyruvate dehydrogenase E1 component beta subunit